jgi:imidazolonepropionase-like amidohydrolase
VIEDAVEGWTVADELGRAGATVVLTPRTRRTKSELLSSEGGSSIENAAKLHAAGCQIAIVPQSKGVDLGGIVGRDILHLPIEAGFAIRGGLPEQAAFEAITIVPARILGVAHRVGSLEVGKDCDLIITDGDILHYETFVQWSVVDGKVVYDKQQELYYAHIRPRPPVDTELAPESKVDPGEEGVDEDHDESSDDDDEGDDEDEGEDGGEDDE